MYGCVALGSSFPVLECVTFCESDEGIFVVPWKNERLSHAHFVERRTTDMSVKMGVLTYMRRRSWFPTTHSCAPAALWNRRRPVAVSMGLIVAHGVVIAKRKSELFRFRVRAKGSRIEKDGTRRSKP